MDEKTKSSLEPVWQNSDCGFDLEWIIGLVSPLCSELGSVAVTRFYDEDW